ncbi:MAG: MBL fold metallo-hydrolase [Spirochaetes bacterium]|nr:MAG: MBL fold metallo-hydrolase [Spirochaetota bacterium]
MNRDFTFTFWGVRGSHPVPQPYALKFGGNTTCLEIRAAGAVVIIDAGTGIIKLGEKLAQEFFTSGEKILELTILFTHLHHDHTQGLPFFTPLYLGQSHLHFFGPRNFGGELSVTLERSMIPPNFPIDFYHSNSVKEVETIKENNMIIISPDSKTPKLINKFQNEVKPAENDMVISIMNDYSHPANGVFVYKIEYKNRAFIFATDVEGYIFGNSKLIEFAKGADYLIHDAQYTKEQYVGLPTPKQGFGHSTAEMAIEVAKRAEVKNLILTHHDPSATDSDLRKRQSYYRRRFRNLTYAYEGLTVKL